MERITTEPLDHEHWLNLRAQVLTSTEISALFKCSPYTTAYEVWHRKANQTIVSLQENERMKWGTRLEASIATGIAEDNGWQVRPMKEFISIPEYKIGSSFDFRVVEPEPMILEIKNVDRLIFMKNWITEDELIEAPLHIELQVQHQMLVAGIDRAYIGALVGGNEVKLIERRADELVHKAIKAEALKFWNSITRGEQPEPNFERDAEFIKSLYQHAEPNKEISADDRISEMAERYKVYSNEEREAAKNKEAVKAELLVAIGDAEKCRGDNFTISAGVVGPTQVSYERKGYRTFRINWRKKK